MVAVKAEYSRPRQIEKMRRILQALVALAALQIAPLLIKVQEKSRGVIDAVLVAEEQSTLVPAAGTNGGVAAGDGTKNPQDDDEEERLAVLISGQCSRFIYRDQAGPLFEFNTQRRLTSGNGGRTVPPKIDVFISLQCEMSNSGNSSSSSQNGTTAVVKAARPWAGYIETPSYISTLNISDIKYWFGEVRGANRVEVKVLEEANMESVDEQVLRHTTQLFQPKGEKRSFDLTAKATQEWGGRWKAEMRKFYNRHAVYRMARKSSSSSARRGGGHKYSGYVYLREDNYFIRPLNVDDVYYDKIANRSRVDRDGGGGSEAEEDEDEEKPFVVVDKPCAFYNAYSDKAYLTNQPGADLLFGPTYSEFLEKMKRYVLYWYFRSTAAVTRKGQFYMPEAYVADSLSNAVVEQTDLYRMDVRYNRGERCAPRLYHKCMARAVKDLARSEHGIDQCGNKK